MWWFISPRIAFGEDALEQPRTIEGNRVIYFGQVSNPAKFAVTQPSAPVGGFMQPVNTLAVAAPYLGLFGFVVAVAIMTCRKRED